MVPAPGQQEGIRIMKKNVETPFKTKVYTYDGEVSLDDLHSGNATPLNVSEIDRWYLGQGVSSKIVRDGSIRGKLFLPGGQISVFSLCYKILCYNQPNKACFLI